MQKNKNIPIDHSDRWELLFHQDYMEFFKLKADLHKMQLYPLSSCHEKTICFKNSI